MKLEILTCAGENGESCTSTPKFRIDGKGEFCRKHGMSALFKSNLAEGARAVVAANPPASGSKSERG